MDITTLEHNRRTTWNEMRGLLDRAEAAGRDLTAGEQREWDALNVDLDRMDQRLAQIRDTEQREADITAAFAKVGGKVGGPSAREWLPGLAEYRALREEQRAVGTSGAFIPIQYADRFFDQIRKRTAVLAAGPVMLPVEGAGSVKVPTITASVTVAGVAEAGAITASDPTLSNITLDPKKFAALTVVNREAVEDSSPQLRQVVANSLLKDLAVEVDRQLVTGDGTGQNLTGLRNISGFTAGASTGTNGGALSFSFLADTVGAADTANLDPESQAWIMHARTWNSVRKLVDSQSRPIISLDPTGPDVRPSLWGRPVYISNSLSITETVGTSTDCSTILLCDMSQIVVAQARQVELVASEDAYFTSDQVGLRVTIRLDIGAPQPAAIVKTVGVRP